MSDLPDNALAPNVPMEGEEHQITRGIGHCNEIASKLAYEVFTAAIEIGAVSSLLQERGFLTQEELKEQRISEGKRLMGIFQEKHIGVLINTDAPDKYAIPADVLPEIDCENRVELCHAACCALRFPLSKQDLDEGIVRWDYGLPYQNRVGPDSYCVHHDRKSLRCTVYENRPSVCRTYDCRQDKRIWLDFEQRVINPDLFTRGSDGTLIPVFKRVAEPGEEIAETPPEESPQTEAGAV